MSIQCISELQDYIQIPYGMAHTSAVLLQNFVKSVDVWFAPGLLDSPQVIVAVTDQRPHLNTDVPSGSSGGHLRLTFGTSPAYLLEQLSSLLTQGTGRCIGHPGTDMPQAGKAVRVTIECIGFVVDGVRFGLP